MTTCPCCGGEGSYLGGLGRLEWFRCQDCGLDFNRDTARTTGCACAGCSTGGLCLTARATVRGLTAADRQGVFWAGRRTLARVWR
jgi:transposase-like protein